MQSRDLVEAHRLVFSAKLYDHQGPIARGGSYQPPPLTVRVMRNALTGRGLMTYFPYLGIFYLPTILTTRMMKWVAESEDVLRTKDVSLSLEQNKKCFVIRSLFLSLLEHHDKNDHFIPLSMLRSCTLS